MFAYLKAADENPGGTAMPKRFLELDAQAPLAECHSKLDAAIADLLTRKPAAKGAPR